MEAARFLVPQHFLEHRILRARTRLAFGIQHTPSLVEVAPPKVG
jgi:hypothetical protein